MLNLVVFVTLVGVATCLLDKELHEMYKTMPRSDFIEYFNKQNFSWTMKDYGEDFSRKYHTCAILNRESFNNLPLLTHGLDAIKDLPQNFDSRQKWSQCDSIRDVLNQGDCGSCWTFGTATTASDRSCIHKNIHVRLSEQDLECSKTNVCGGGMPMEAFEFWRDQGLVTQQCKPYNIEELLKNKCTKKCVDNSINYVNDKHYATKVYRVSSDSEQIKAELVNNGPIQAGFTVFQDFFKYNGGVYEHKTGEEVGRHSVRIIGYGVENGKDYWLVVNSWGNSWGDNGLFKIKSYQSEIEFESYLISGFPKN